MTAEKDRLFILVLVAALAYFFWNWPVFYPIRVFTVLLHESGHAVAGLLTGGDVSSIKVFSNVSGVCYASGLRPVVLAAGYIGAMFFGCLILLAAARTAYDRSVSAALGIAVLLVTFLYIRNVFGFLAGLAWGGGLLYAGRRLDGEVNDFLLSFVGLTVCFHGLNSAWAHLIQGRACNTDAKMMAREYFGPHWLWGWLWMGVIVVLFLGTLALVLKPKRR
ncbi:MAG: M50 family metallopeptidase [Elusimicrobia bacterium]|nr:M50 family metallopeptidase [Elusimicrobiota bacterium]